MLRKVSALRSRSSLDWTPACNKGRKEGRMDLPVPKFGTSVVFYSVSVCVPGVVGWGDSERYAWGWQHVHVLQMPAQSASRETVTTPVTVFQTACYVALIKTPFIIVSFWDDVMYVLYYIHLLQKLGRSSERLALDFSWQLILLNAAWKPISLYHRHTCCDS